MVLGVVPNEVQKRLDDAVSQCQLVRFVPVWLARDVAFEGFQVIVEYAVCEDGAKETQPHQFCTERDGWVVRRKKAIADAHTGWNSLSRGFKKNQRSTGGTYND